MSRKIQQQRLSKVGNHVAVEQTVASDDSLLPSAGEFAAYQQVDSAIVPWILEQSKAEQIHRHKSDDEKIRLMRKAITNDRLFIILFFAIVFVFIGLCALFVWFERNVAGTLFGITGLIGAYFLYARFLKGSKK